MTVKEWLLKFLNQNGRELTAPDGRTLFAYQISKEEFEDLNCLLSTCMASRGSKVGFANNTGKVFVLYGAEWWRRNFDGGPWRWDLITRSIGWEDVDQKYLTPLVTEGLKYWQRDLVKNRVGNAYLTSIVLEGGIPLLLLQQQGASFTRYLKAVIGEHAKWSGAGMSAHSHAVSCQRVLTAKSLRKEQIFQLAANIVDVIYTLSENLESRADPFGELNSKHPGWQRELPMAIEVDGAKDLVEALLKEAQKKRSSKYERFIINRYLTQFDGKWVQRASLEVPDSIPAEVVAEQLGISIANLPSRMELVARTNSFALKAASLMRVQREQDEYKVSFYRRENLSFNLPFTEEIKCAFQSGDRAVGTYNTEGSEPVDTDLPLLFVADDTHDWRLLGMGSLTTRVELGRLVLPPGAELIEGEAQLVDEDEAELKFLEATVYSIDGEALVRLQDGFSCRIRMGANRDAGTHYSLIGKRLFALEQKGIPVFSGMPSLVPPSGGTRPDKIVWRADYTGSEWMEGTSIPPLGCIRLRALAQNECIYSTKLVVLPSCFSYSISCSESLDEGTLIFQGLSGAEVSYTGSAAIDVVIESENDIAAVACHSQHTTGGRFPINLGWSQSRYCTLIMPFPGEGARFTNIESGDVCGRQVSISELLKLSAQAVSPSGTGRYKIVAELRAGDIDKSISRSSMYFERAVPQVSECLFDLPLVDLYEPIKQLFSYSADLDAVVRIDLISSAKAEAFVDIVQFDGELSFDPTERIVTYNNYSSNYNRHPTLRLLPFNCDRDSEQIEQSDIFSAEDEPILEWNLDRFGSEDTGLIIAEGQLGNLIRPCVMYTPVEPENNSTIEYPKGRKHLNEDLSKDQIQEPTTPPLSEVWQLPSAFARKAAFKEICDLLPDDNQNDEWIQLVQYVQRFQEAHPDCLDAHESIIDSAGSILGVIFRSQPEVVDVIMEWESYLPLRLWMLPFAAWKKAINGYLESIAQYGEAIVNLEKDKLINILEKIKAIEPNTILVVNEVLNDLGCLQCMTEHEEVYLKAGGDFQKYIKEVQKTVARTMFGRPGDERWPGGLDREVWNNVCKNPLWLDPGIGYRKPFLDAPIFAAFCVAKGVYLERQHRAFIAAIRNFDSRSFDDIYLRFLVMFINLIK